MVVEGSRKARSLARLSPNNAESPDEASGSHTPSSDSIESRLSKLGLNISQPLQNGTAKEDATNEKVHKQNRAFPNGKTERLTERSYLGILTMAALLEKGHSDQRFALAFLLHMVLVEAVGLDKRHLHATRSQNADQVGKFFARFSVEALKALRSAKWGQVMDSNSVDCDVVDVVDGRLLVVILQSLKTIHDKVMGEKKLAVLFSRLSHALATLGCDKLDTTAKNLSMDIASPAKKSSKVVASNIIASILPFSSPIFDRHLAAIKISVAGSRPPRPESARIFQEVTHWHNAKRRLDAKATKELTGKEKSRALRRNQFFMAEMFSYAASLTNAAGKMLEPETITVGEAKKPTAKMLEANKENESKVKVRASVVFV